MAPLPFHCVQHDLVPEELVINVYRTYIFGLKFIDTRRRWSVNFRLRQPLSSKENNLYPFDRLQW